MRYISASLLHANSHIISMMATNVYHVRDFGDVRRKVLVVVYTGVCSLFNNFGQMLNL